MTLIGGSENRFKDNLIFTRPDVKVNTHPVFREMQGSRGNVYEGNIGWGGGKVPVERM